MSGIQQYEFLDLLRREREQRERTHHGFQFNYIFGPRAVSVHTLPLLGMTIVLFGEEHRAPPSIPDESLTINPITLEPFVRNQNRSGDNGGRNIDVERYIFALAGVPKLYPELQWKVDIFLERPLRRPDVTDSLSPESLDCLRASTCRLHSKLMTLDLIFNACATPERIACATEPETRVHAIDYRFSSLISARITNLVLNHLRADSPTRDDASRERALDEITSILRRVRSFGLQHYRGAVTDSTLRIYVNCVLYEDDFDEFERSIVTNPTADELSQVRYKRRPDGILISRTRAQLDALAADGEIGERISVSIDNFIMDHALLQFKPRLSVDDVLTALTLVMDAGALARVFRSYGGTRHTDIVVAYLGDLHRETWDAFIRGHLPDKPKFSGTLESPYGSGYVATAVDTGEQINTGDYLLALIDPGMHASVAAIETPTKGVAIGK